MNHKQAASCFPYMHYKQNLYNVDLDYLRSILTSSGDLVSIIRKVYDKKLWGSKTGSEVNPKKHGEHSEKLHKFKQIINRCLPHSEKSKGERMTLYFKREYESEGRPLTSPREEEKNPVHPFEIANYPPEEEKKQETVVIKNYLNNMKTFCAFEKPDSLSVITSTLRDLSFLLNKSKKQSNMMFRTLGKTKIFANIEKAACSFTLNTFLNQKGEPTESPDNMWLQTEDEKLCFFINLFNFLILYAFCKTSSPPPASLEGFLEFAKSQSLRIGDFVMSAHEIEHAILKAEMDFPHYPGQENRYYQKYKQDDIKNKLFHVKRNLLMLFALYWPCKSSPPLRVYDFPKFHKQLQANATKYLDSTVKVDIGKSKITLPSMLQWHINDFDEGNGVIDMLKFVASLLSSSGAKKLNKIISSGNPIKEICYLTHNWSFSFDYLKD